MPAHAPRGPIKDRNAEEKALDVKHLLDTLGYIPCTATSKQSGNRCKRRPIPGGMVCVMHGGGAKQVQATAKLRLLALQPLAIQTLHALLQREEFPTVQLGAAKDVLDRTEGKPTESVNLQHDGTLEIRITKPW